MAKLTDYTAATRFDSGDILIKDGTGGTKKITATDAAVEFAGLVSAMNHRNVYRGKFLGNAITTVQKAAISAGTFDDLFIGDYWTINGRNWQIADMDYFYNSGNNAITKHHLVILPTGSMYTGKMNETNTTEGGYTGSIMYTEGLETAKTEFANAFGDLLLTHKEYLVNAVTNGSPSAGAWFDSQVELMNEIMVYGSYIFTPANNGVLIPSRHTINTFQLALFGLNPMRLRQREDIWLRDTASASHFARMTYFGIADASNASNSNGVRPYGIIG